MSVDVEIYMNNIIKFFKDNPKDLLNLVPKDKENEFYLKMKEQAFENYEKGEEIPLTQQQIILICVELNQMCRRVWNSLVPCFVNGILTLYLQEYILWIVNLVVLTEEAMMRYRVDR